MTYDEALTNCEDQGAKLANIQNRTEQEFIRRMFNVEFGCMHFLNKMRKTLK